MMETAVVVTMLVSIVVAFSGIIFGIINMQAKRITEQLRCSVETNATRISILEKQDAIRGAESQAILETLKELKERVNYLVERG